MGIHACFAVAHTLETHGPRLPQPFRDDRPTPLPPWESEASAEIYRLTTRLCPSDGTLQFHIAELSGIFHEISLVPRLAHKSHGPAAVATIRVTMQLTVSLKERWPILSYTVYTK